MGLTENQKKCATTFGKTLAIKAGAGTGKTFTLTERIANAYKQKEINSISEVCAITFTNAAANELKARISTKLKKAEGVEDEQIKKAMLLDSYNVDNAWISTIHGFCSRILKESALDLGIDFHFDIIPEYLQNRFLAEAINETIDEIKLEKIDGIDTRSANTILQKDTKIKKEIEKLIDYASTNIHGWEAIDVGTPSENTEKIKNDLTSECENLATLINNHYGNTSERANVAIQLWMETATKLSSLDKTSPPENVAKCIENVYFDGRLSKKDFKEPYANLIKKFIFQAEKIFLLLNKPYLETLISIAQHTQKKYEEKKKQLNYLDNNDLLRQAYHALTRHQEILDRYKDKFSLIMVDEFQDTDLMQFETIKLLAGENLKRLCVVGDFQQSIYRFRGADVSIFTDHINKLGEDSENVIRLQDNYRSHDAVLKYVKNIFSEDEMFGGNFLNLECNRKDTEFNLGEGQNSFKRINLIYASNTSATSFNDEQKDQAKRHVARKVASLFKELKESYGHEPKEMALLLEKMDDASLYAEEFRKADLPSIISGGSGLNDTNEIHLIEALMKLALNPQNTQDLATVLLSPLFSISGNDILCFVGEGKLHTISSILKGSAPPVAPEDIEQNMLQALRILQMFMIDTNNQPLSVALNQVFVRSGYYLRKEKEGVSGLASIGNIKKGLDILHSLENLSPTGISSLCKDYFETLDKGKESPGMLALDEMNCIKIMTIHASKGLEFPIVAVGGFSSKRHNKYSLKTTSYQNKVKAYYELEKNKTIEEQLKKKSKDEPNFTADKKPFSLSVKNEEEIQNEEEKKRLLYVALTRAREALIVADINMEKSTKNKGKKYPVNHAKLCSKGLFLPFSDLLLNNINNELSERTETSFYFSYDGKEEGVFYHLNLPELLSEVEESECLTENPKQESTQKSFLAPKVDEQYLQYSTKILPHAFLAESSENEEEATQTEQTNVITLPSPLTSYSSFISEENEEQNAIISQLGDTYCTTVDRAYVETSSKKDAAKENDTKTHLSAEEVEDRATNLGSAFHRLAQYASICRLAEDSPSMPSADKIKRIGRAYQLDEVELKRIEAAIKLWVESPLAKTTFAYPIHKEEMEFAVPLQGMPVVLEGAIDLYCGNEDGSKAWIIDYKTGGHEFEREATLKKKHALQAAVYAYIALNQGALEVDVVFARIEHASEGNPKEPQKVIYHFKKSDLEDISTKLVAIKNAE